MRGGGGGLCTGLSSFYSILPSFCFPHPVLSFMPSVFSEFRRGV